MDCFECSMEFSNTDGLVTHLSDAHGLSRLEARKRVVAAPESAESEQPDSERGSESEQADPEPLPESDREAMLCLLKREIVESEYLPGPGTVHSFDEYDYTDYVEEFGSVMGAAALTGEIWIDPDEYSHTADGSKQYSEWELVNEIWRLFESSAGLSLRMMDTHGRVSSQTYKYRFGSWSQALKKAHIDGPGPSVDPSRQPRNKHYAKTDWQALRQQALERDDFECQSCGMAEDEHQAAFGVGLNVHHIKDIATFDNPAEADSLDNLETLCVECHGQNHPFAE
jgi:hypothetical protein